jgi:hypothetical protein
VAHSPNHLHYKGTGYLLEPVETRQREGQAGREWDGSHHGWRIAVGRQLAIYEELVKDLHGRAVIGSPSG